MCGWFFQAVRADEWQRNTLLKNLAQISQKFFNIGFTMGIFCEYKTNARNTDVLAELANFNADLRNFLCDLMHEFFSNKIKTD